MSKSSKQKSEEPTDKDEGDAKIWMSILPAIIMFIGFVMFEGPFNTTPGNVFSNGSIVSPVTFFVIGIGLMILAIGLITLIWSEASWVRPLITGAWSILGFFGIVTIVTATEAKELVIQPSIVLLSGVGLLVLGAIMAVRTWLLSKKQ